MPIDQIFLELESSYDNDPIKDRLRFIERLTAEVAYKILPSGTSLSFKNEQHFVAEKIFSKAGALITVLTERDAPHKALILCRGTETDSWLSLVNDLSIDFGFYGIVHNIQDLQDYLKSKKITKVYIAGKSLGGSHAQYLAALLPQKILAVATVNCPGTPKAVRKCTKKRSYSTYIIRTNGDYIPLVGGPHATGTGSIKGFHLKPPKEEWDNYELTTKEKIKKFFSSSTLEHIRQVTREIFDFKEFDHTHKPMIKIGNTFEYIRLCIAHAFNVVTLGYFNPYRFKNFAEEWIKNNPPYDYSPSNNLKTRAWSSL